MGKRCNIRKDWEFVKNDILYNILKAKFEQNEDIRINLLNTYFRSIRENCPNKTNRLGIILEKVRDHFYELETLKE